ncbi:purine-nucleoside phosphorylase [Saccharopolyspora erythraea NRRL 2338]|uniref:Purine nucleoside phosphorylase n=1 Tax=Saccharopolyspora erythraea TaxID=1836 RepID=A0ABN1D5Z8_SACER|nr:purine nucleoside phosphorylase [Saccharopolyspora erythraea D]PFG99355.1 purine-nucleoside phosphorylase [Saccharopolyspora erythraea NRRL 2338]
MPVRPRERGEHRIPRTARATKLCTVTATTTTDAHAAASAIADATGIQRHDMAVVLGSGWQPAAEEIGAPETEMHMSDLPGFAPPSAIGHSGKVWSVPVAGKHVLVMLGRTHMYEGKGVEPVAHGVRTAAAAGCRTVVLTNAAGGLREGMFVGQPVLISDHVNMTARSPLVGADFVDLTDLYSPRLRDIAREIDSTLEEGVYAGLPGPHFETPAEIRMLRGLGVDLVGMSTVLEAIAARAAGAEVFGLSLVTNLAAGLSGEPLSHQEVLDAGRAAASRMGGLLRALVERA